MKAVTFVPLVVLLAASVPSQSVQVGASGTLYVSLQPSSGPVITYTRTVAGPTSLVQSGVGSAVVTTGAVSELLLTADSPPWTCYGCWSQAAGDVVFEFGAAAPVAGVLRLQLVPACFMGMPPVIDVNADGSYELIGANATQTVDIPVVLAVEPLRIRVVGNSVNFGGANCSYPLHVEFLAQPANLNSVNAPCGPTLAAALTGLTNRSLTLRFGGMAGQLGALFVGAAPTPQPGPCALATVPAAAVILAPNPAGAEFLVPIAASLVGVYTLQYVELMADGRLVWSNGVAAVLP